MIGIIRADIHLLYVLLQVLKCVILTRFCSEIHPHLIPKTFFEKMCFYNLATRL